MNYIFGHTILRGLERRLECSIDKMNRNVLATENENIDQVSEKKENTT